MRNTAVFQICSSENDCYIFQVSAMNGEYSLTVGIKSLRKLCIMGGKRLLCWPPPKCHEELLQSCVFFFLFVVFGVHL